jgi:beta-galactosidase/beta-glucuronidase
VDDIDARWADLNAKATARWRATQIHAPEDPEILALCERLGFGAVMDSAARQWALRDPVGALYIGGCLGTAKEGA